MYIVVEAFVALHLLNKPTVGGRHVHIHQRRENVLLPFFSPLSRVFSRFALSQWMVEL
jgi:hypothetical protein